jgi:predicted amidohydrolase
MIAANGCIANMQKPGEKGPALLATYNVTVIQPTLRPVYKGAEGTFRPECMRENVDHLCALVEQAGKEHEAKLVVFPEFCLQGFAARRSITDWERAGVLLPGKETAALAMVAKSTGVTIAGAAVERIPEFRGRYFMSGFLIGPEGTEPEDHVQLVYRKLYGLSAKTRPGDIHDTFVATFGRQSLFPVVDTPLGKIGCAIAGDVAMPEMVRALALRGAEVVLVPAAATYQAGLPAPSGAANQRLDANSSQLRRVRAWENLVYLAFANIGPFIDGDGAVGTARVPSEIIDYLGRVKARARTSEETMVTTRVDLEALRQHRADVRFNYLAQVQPALHAAEYASAKTCPLNGFEEHVPADEQDMVDFIAKHWRDAVKSGRFNG